MARHFKSVGDAVRYRMRHGLSRAALARMTGLHLNCIVDCLKSSKETSEKTLELLGLRRVSYFEQLHPFKTRERKPKLRKRASLAVPIARPHAKPIPRQTPTESIVSSVPSLSTENVLIAVRYRLNPLHTWNAFNAQADLTSFEAFCQSRSDLPGQSENTANTAAPLLYGHLKQTEPVKDFRRPIVRGELPKLEPINQPTVTVDS